MANIIEITDFLDPRLDVYARMTENQLLCRENPAEGMFIAESAKVTQRALEAGYEPISFLMEPGHIEGEAKELLAGCAGVPVFVAEHEILRNLTGYPMTRGILCAMRRRALPSVQEICRGASRVAALERIVNPTNVGAVFRSAAALGMDAVLLSRDCSDPLYRRAVRVSMGTVFQVPWTYLDPGGKTRQSATGVTRESICILREAGFATAAMALSDRAVALSDPALLQEKKLAVILGTEGDGLLPETQEACDYIVKIPMSHGVDSLNVAAASAVAFYVLGKH
ncbi:MAG: RNA methyltransferase [Blautia sp.]|nr:RNA methyltransferase [Blautia sp.]